MAARLSGSGRVTLPKSVRETLHLSAGDWLEFRFNSSGELVLRKVDAAPAAEAGDPQLQHRGTAQMRRRAAELLALLRGLD
jgi:AbrB family looped-hinge helix DNA binding protein